MQRTTPAPASSALDLAAGLPYGHPAKRAAWSIDCAAKHRAAGDLVSARICIEAAKRDMGAAQ